ncbi:MAG: hypothetical protein JO297_02845 [Nitrososphaeraceae archaeon]|nr:hypothetical protein [Nitrososphaeraceae archaeon]
MSDVLWLKTIKSTHVVDTNLEILKEWESDERTILEKFIKLLIQGKEWWYFIPIGNNLDFDFRFINNKLKHYFGDNTSSELSKTRKLDLLTLCVMMNDLKFKGCTDVLGKSHRAKDMLEWYAGKNYDRIEGYIKEEADDFVKSFSIMYAEMPKLKHILKHFSFNRSHQKANYNITNMNT